MVGFFFWTFLVLFILISLFMILLILIQKGRGGGLASAFGGAGGNTAFGSKTGDVLTWVTSIAFGVFLVVAILLNRLADWRGDELKGGPAANAAVVNQPTPPAVTPPVPPAATPKPTPSPATKPDAGILGQPTMTPPASLPASLPAVPEIPTTLPSTGIMPATPTVPPVPAVPAIPTPAVPATVPSTQPAK